MNFIEIKDLTFAYSSSPDFVLKNINLSFNEKEIVAIIGVNGAGKTTLAKLMIGMLRPQKGEIFIEGIPASKKSIANIAEKIGFVFQNPNIMLFTQEVQKELELSLQRFDFSREEKEERINHMLDFLGLKKYAKFHPRLLSRGEKQKLSIATTLIQEPQMIILDEPFSGIDISQKNIIRNFLLTLKEQGKLVIIITHDLESIIELSDRVIALKNGEIFFDGAPKDFFTKEENIKAIGLTETDYLALVYKLRKNGLPKTILNKAELIGFFSQKFKA